MSDVIVTVNFICVFVDRTMLVIGEHVQDGAYGVVVYSRTHA